MIDINKKKSYLESPLISIIMNCYNGETHLQEAIESVYNQTYKNWEIILWDNASTDRTAEIANQYDNRLKYFRNKETEKLSIARNKALDNSSGDLVTFLDCDDILKPRKLMTQINLLIENKAGMVYCSYDLIDACGRIIENKKIKGHCVKNRNDVKFSQLIKKYNIGLLTPIIQKKVLDTHKIKFSEETDFSGDYYFFLQVASHTRVVSTDAVLCYYRHHSNSLTWRTSYSEKALECDRMMQEKKLTLNPSHYKCFLKREKERKKKFMIHDCLDRGSVGEFLSVSRSFPILKPIYLACYLLSLMPSFIIKWGHIIMKQKLSFRSPENIS
jgi:glycosyltransferase involved in cell wall biosynthesis